MLLKTLIKPKKELTTVKEDCTLEEALHVLEDSGYRCVPILDESGKIFRGNIYKMHIYRHKSRGGEPSCYVSFEKCHEIRFNQFSIFQRFLLDQRLAVHYGS